MGRARRPRRNRHPLSRRPTPLALLPHRDLGRHLAPRGLEVDRALGGDDEIGHRHQLVEGFGQQPAVEEHLEARGEPRTKHRGARTKRSTDGIGLGLSIAKTIVEAHGGNIWLSSLPGKGCTFYFTIPVDGARA